MGSRTKNAPVRKRLARPVTGAELRNWARHPTVRIMGGRAATALLQQKAALDHAANVAMGEHLTMIGQWLVGLPEGTSRSDMVTGITEGAWLPAADEQSEAGGPPEAPAVAQGAPESPAAVVPAPFRAVQSDAALEAT